MMDDNTREAEAEQLAALMNELGASIWQGVVNLDNDPKGPRIAMRMDEHGDSVSWKYMPGNGK
jgi:hypothetical protein